MLRLLPESDILTVLLDRPAQRNAMSAGLVAEMIERVADFAADDRFRTLVVAGSGVGFCAGSDLGGLAGMDAAAREEFEAESGRLARLLGEVDNPVVAAVHGFVIGGGLTLAIAADIVVTEAAAVWSLPEVPIGLFPAWGLGPLLRRVGQANARRLAWGIDRLDGREAQRLGLADSVTEGSALEEAQAVARRLAALPAAQARAVKRFFAAEDAGGDEAANRAFMAACDTQEAATSFARYAAKAQSAG